MIEKINEIIRESLPEQTAKELRSYLDNAEKINKDNDDLKKQLSLITSKYDDQSGQMLVLKEKLQERENVIKDYQSREELVLHREKDITEREIKQALNDLKVEHAKDKVDFVRETFNTVFKNTIVKKRVLEDKSFVIEDNYTHYDNNGIPHTIKNPDTVVPGQSKKEEILETE